MNQRSSLSGLFAYSLHYHNASTPIFRVYTYFPRLYDKDQKVLLGFPGGVSVANISDSCTTIDRYSFSMSHVQKLIMGKNVEIVELASFEKSKDLTEIVISPGLVSISSYAFKYSNLSGVSIELPSSFTSFNIECFAYSSLKSIDMGKTSVKMVNRKAFLNCKDLESVRLSSNLTKIDTEAFSGCSSLKNIIFPTSLSTLSDKSFSDCVSLASVDFGGCSIEKIPTHCFSNTSIESIDIPKSVTSLEQGAFKDCTKLTEFIIGDDYGVEWIMPSVFSGCSRMTRIYIGQSVGEIGTRALYGVDSLVSIEVSESNRNYSSPGNILYNKEGTVLLSFPGGLKSCTIDGNVEAIAEYAFFECKNLVNLSMSPSLPLVSIASFTFSGCISLTSVTFPRLTASISDDAFRGCMSLERVEFVEGSDLREISSGSFRSCTALRSVIFGAGSGLRLISENSFRDCKSLCDFELPSGLETIGARAFEGCVSLTFLNFPPSISRIGSDAFRSCTGLRTISYCFNESSPAEREFSSNAFTDTKIDCVISTAEAGEYFCGRPIVALMDSDCQIGTRRFTQLSGAQIELRLSHFTVNILCGEAEDWHLKGKCPRLR